MPGNGGLVRLAVVALVCAAAFTSGAVASGDGKTRPGHGAGHAPFVIGGAVALSPSCDPGAGFGALGPYDPDWDKATARLLAESAFGRPYSETIASTWWLPWCTDRPAPNEGVDCSSYVAKTLQLAGPNNPTQPYDRLPYVTGPLYDGWVKTVSRVDLDDYLDRPEALSLSGFVMSQADGGPFDHTGLVMGYRKSKGLLYTYEARSTTLGIGPALWVKPSEAGTRFFVRHNWSSAPNPVLDDGPVDLAAPAKPRGIAAGGSGDVWYTASVSNAIGKVTTEGVFESFELPTANAFPIDITAGPKGVSETLWFTENTGNRVGRITASGEVAEFRLTDPSSMPVSITPGPDRAMWFTQARGGGGGLGRIDAAGSITDVDLGADGALPSGVAVGPRGDLWTTYLVDSAGVKGGFGRIARVGTDGRLKAVFELPKGIGAGAITAGPDGNMWFAAAGIGALGTITPRGQIRLHEIEQSPRRLLGGKKGIRNSSPRDVVVGLDRKLWFPLNVIGDQGQIGKMSLRGRTTLYELPERDPDSVSLWGMTSGPGRQLWFGELAWGLIAASTTRGDITEFTIPAG